MHEELAAERNLNFLDWDFVGELENIENEFYPFDSIPLNIVKENWLIFINNPSIGRNNRSKNNNSNRIKIPEKENKLIIQLKQPLLGVGRFNNKLKTIIS